MPQLKTSLTWGLGVAGACPHQGATPSGADAKNTPKILPQAEEASKSLSGAWKTTEMGL